MGLLATALVAGAIGFGLSGGDGTTEPVLAADPNDPAMVFSNDDPCVAPCVKTGVVYASVASKLNPA
ncbi:MAG: hypothetical protein JHD16_13625, partial [Solirubrobacteraceae bacterium]|nr:hypothetical protein [Solirubrobacteraceae bacterium]